MCMDMISYNYYYYLLDPSLYLLKHSTTITAITMATRHTTTITAPTVMPISVVQERTTASIVGPTLSKDWKQNVLYSNMRIVSPIIILTSGYEYIDELTVQLVRLGANGHILTNVVCIHSQTNRGNDRNWRHKYILPIAIVDSVSINDVSSIRWRTPADLHWGRGTRLSGSDIERRRRNWIKYCTSS